MSTNINTLSPQEVPSDVKIATELLNTFYGSGGLKVFDHITDNAFAIACQSEEMAYMLLPRNSTEYIGFSGDNMQQWYKTLKGFANSINIYSTSANSTPYTGSSSPTTIDGFVKSVKLADYWPAWIMLSQRAVYTNSQYNNSFNNYPKVVDVEHELHKGVAILINHIITSYGNVTKFEENSQEWLQAANKTYYGVTKDNVSVMDKNNNLNRSMECIYATCGGLSANPPFYSPRISSVSIEGANHTKIVSNVLNTCLFPTTHDLSTYPSVCSVVGLTTPHTYSDLRTQQITAFNYLTRYRDELKVGTGGKDPEEALKDFQDSSILALSKQKDSYVGLLGMNYNTGLRVCWNDNIDSIRKLNVVGTPSGYKECEKEAQKQTGFNPKHQHVAELPFTDVDLIHACIYWHGRSTDFRPGEGAPTKPSGAVQAKYDEYYEAQHAYNVAYNSYNIVLNGLLSKKGISYTSEYVSFDSWCVKNGYKDQNTAKVLNDYPTDGNYFKAYDATSKIIADIQSSIDEFKSTQSKTFKDQLTYLNKQITSWKTKADAYEKICGKLKTSGTEVSPAGIFGKRLNEALNKALKKNNMVVTVAKSLQESNSFNGIDRTHWFAHDYCAFSPVIAFTFNLVLQNNNNWTLVIPLINMNSFANAPNPSDQVFAWTKTYEEMMKTILVSNSHKPLPKPTIGLRQTNDSMTKYYTPNDDLYKYMQTSSTNWHNLTPRLPMGNFNNYSKYLSIDSSYPSTSTLSFACIPHHAVSLRVKEGKPFNYALYLVNAYKAEQPNVVDSLDILINLLASPNLTSPYINTPLSDSSYAYGSPGAYDNRITDLQNANVALTDCATTLTTGSGNSTWNGNIANMWGSVCRDSTNVVQNKNALGWNAYRTDMTDDSMNSVRRFITYYLNGMMDAVASSSDTVDQMQSTSHPVYKRVQECIFFMFGDAPSTYSGLYNPPPNTKSTGTSPVLTHRQFYNYSNTHFHKIGTCNNIDELSKSRYMMYAWSSYTYAIHSWLNHYSTLGYNEPPAQYKRVLSKWHTVDFDYIEAEYPQWPARACYGNSGEYGNNNSCKVHMCQNQYTGCYASTQNCRWSGRYQQWGSAKVVQPYGPPGSGGRNGSDYYSNLTQIMHRLIPKVPDVGGDDDLDIVDKEYKDSPQLNYLWELDVNNLERHTKYADETHVNQYVPPFCSKETRDGVLKEWANITKIRPNWLGTNDIYASQSSAYVAMYTPNYCTNVQMLPMKYNGTYTTSTCGSYGYDFQMYAMSNCASQKIVMDVIANVNKLLMKYPALVLANRMSTVVKSMPKNYSTDGLHFVSPVIGPPMINAEASFLLQYPNYIADNIPTSNSYSWGATVTIADGTQPTDYLNAFYINQPYNGSSRINYPTTFTNVQGLNRSSTNPMFADIVVDDGKLKHKTLLQIVKPLTSEQSSISTYVESDFVSTNIKLAQADDAEQLVKYKSEMVDSNKNDLTVKINNLNSRIADVAGYKTRADAAWKELVSTNSTSKNIVYIDNNAPGVTVCRLREEIDYDGSPMYLTSSTNKVSNYAEIATPTVDVSGTADDLVVTFNCRRDHVTRVYSISPALAVGKKISAVITKDDYSSAINANSTDLLDAWADTTTNVYGFEIEYAFKSFYSGATNPPWLNPLSKPW